MNHYGLAKLVFLLLQTMFGMLATALAVNAQDITEQRRAVLRIETQGRKCTAVCVSPDGDLLTVGHCKPSRNSKVTIGGQRFNLEVVSDRRGTLVDHPVRLRIAAKGPFPFVRMALNAPVAGDRVYSIGFPAGQFSYKEGRVRKIFTRTVQNGRFRQQFIETNFRVHEGNSGGPLFNSVGEVVGLASTRTLHPSEKGYTGEPPATHWIHTEELRSIFGAPTQQFRRRRTLYIFSTARCSGCQFVKRHESQLRKEWRPHGDVVFVESGSQEFAEIEARCYKATGKRIDTFPAFWVEGTTVVEQDYRKFTSLSAGGFSVLSVVRWAVRSIAHFLVGRIRERRRQRDEAAPSPTPRPAPEQAPETPKAVYADWSGVRVIVTLPTTEGADSAKRLALGFAKGRIERRLAEATKGKASLLIASERLNAARYEAVLQAAGLDAGRHLLVLVPAQNRGLVKSLIYKKITTVVEGRLSALPVDVVFERTHPRDYSNIIAALSVQPKPSEEQASDGVSMWDLINGGVAGSALITALAALWRRRKRAPEGANSTPNPPPNTTPPAS